MQISPLFFRQNILMTFFLIKTQLYTGIFLCRILFGQQNNPPTVSFTITLILFEIDCLFRVYLLDSPVSAYVFFVIFCLLFYDIV